MMILSIDHDILYAHTADRRIALQRVTYEDRRLAAEAVGMRPAVASVVAAGELDLEQAKRLGREVGLLNAESGTQG